MPCYLPTVSSSRNNFAGDNLDADQLLTWFDDNFNHADLDYLSLLNISCKEEITSVLCLWSGQVKKKASHCLSNFLICSSRDLNHQVSIPRDVFLPSVLLFCLSLSQIGPLI